MSKLRLIFIDGNELTRALFSYVLDDSSGIEIVGEASDHHAAMALIKKFAPDAIIIGYDLPPKEDSRLRSHLQAEFPRVQIIELSELDRAVSEKLISYASESTHSRLIH